MSFIWTYRHTRINISSESVVSVCMLEELLTMGFVCWAYLRARQLEMGPANG